MESPSDIRITRRAALAAAMGGGAALAACEAAQTRPAGAPEKKKKRVEWGIKLSASTLMFKDLSVQDALKKISELDYQGVDIWAGHTGCKHLQQVQDRLGPQGLRELLLQTNLSLYSFSVYGGGFKKYADLLGEVGGGIAVRGSERPAKPKQLTGRMKKFIESLREEVDLASQNNSYLAISNHSRQLLNNLDAIKAFMDINKHPRLGLAIAPFHLQVNKVSVPEAIRSAGSKLLFFYAWQRGKDDEQMPGIGPGDMTPWMRALAQINYRWYVNPFMANPPRHDKAAIALRKSRDYLLECYGRVVGG